MIVVSKEYMKPHLLFLCGGHCRLIGKTEDAGSNPASDIEMVTVTKLYARPYIVVTISRPRRSIKRLPERYY